MATSAACDTVQQVLESAAGMDRWAVKGAIQLALMDGGLDAKSVTAVEMKAVVAELLPRQLETQKVAHVAAVCDKIRAALGLIDEASGRDTPDRVFQRLGR